MERSRYELLEQEDIRNLNDEMILKKLQPLSNGKASLRVHAKLRHRRLQTSDGTQSLSPLRSGNATVELSPNSY